MKPAYTQLTKKRVNDLFDLGAEKWEVKQALHLDEATLAAIVEECARDERQAVKDYIAAIRAEVPQTDDTPATYSTTPPAAKPAPLLELFVVEDKDRGTLLVSIEVSQASLAGMENVTRSLASLLANQLSNPGDKAL